MELGTRFKGVFCGGDFFRHAGNLSIYCLPVLKVVETQRILEIIGRSATVSESLRLNLALHFKLYLTKLLYKTHRVRIIFDINLR